MREIFDYKDIRRLEDTSLHNMIKEGIVVTATSELAAAMSLYYLDYKVFDIHSFISGIIPEWEENVKDVKNYVMLRNVIEDYVYDNEVREEVATYLRRNAGDMWNAIKLLIEADVYPDDIDNKCSEPIGLFREIWKKLEVENDQIFSVKSIFNYELGQKNVVLERIEKIVKEIKENIYLFGFYFITPIQDRIFDILEDTGFNLIFLNCHDQRYDYASQIWKKTFSQYDNGKVTNLQTDIVLDNYFGEALAGNTKKLPVFVTKHYTQFDFAEMVKAAIDKGEVVYSPDAKQCEQILKEYFPECYDKKHLLSYPVGQYIYYLHMMWSTFNNKMDMKFEYVYKCFASGWLNRDEINGRDYLYEMKILEPYFKFCHEEDDWRERFQKLKDAKNIVDAFNSREKGEERWHKLLGNPFENMGVYTITDESIEAIYKLIHKLIEDANYLFASTDKTDLFEHFQRISRIIHEHIDKDDLLEEEIEIANELLVQLNDESSKGVTCPMNGIRDAIILLIGDHFGEYETQEEETANKHRMVLPLSMVEAAMLNNYGQTVHLVLANEFALPGQPKNLPWPLTDKMLDTLQIEGRNKTIKYVNDMRSVIENRPLSYRYLFYSFMGISNTANNTTLSIEWICRNENKEIDISSYVKLMSLNENRINDDIGNKNDYLQLLETNDSDYLKKEILFPQKEVPDEVRMDYLLCKERYLYSYLLNYLPAYTSEFHYSFELSKMISAFAILSGIDKDTVTKNITDLYPFLRHIELRQSSDFASSQGKPEPVNYEGIEYPGQRYLTHYIKDSLIGEARKRDDEYLENGMIHNEIPEEACVYCPYSGVCIVRHRYEVAEYE